MWEGFLYLATVVDVCRCKLVGWAMGARQTAVPVQSALDIVLQARSALGMIFHSDRVSQYTNLAFTRRCEQAGVRRSLGATGNCFDNALAESSFATRDQAGTEIFRFLGGFYNRRRRHSTSAISRRWSLNGRRRGVSSYGAPSPRPTLGVPVPRPFCSK